MVIGVGFPTLTENVLIVSRWCHLEHSRNGLRCFEAKGASNMKDKGLEANGAHRFHASRARSKPTPRGRVMCLGVRRGLSADPVRQPGPRAARPAKRTLGVVRVRIGYLSGLITNGGEVGRRSPGETSTTKRGSIGPHGRGWRPMAAPLLLGQGHHSRRSRVVRIRADVADPQVALILLASVVLAIGLQPSIRWLENRGLRRGWAWP